MSASWLIAALCVTAALLCWWAPSYLGADPAGTTAWRLGSELFSVVAIAGGGAWRDRGLNDAAQPAYGDTR
jgi:hypothetical protein